ncbi:calponin homology domain-containing protein DDB_G0272472-like [Clytia hemisphaerica]|uniref:Uncharacterized protein n=1 Tax=Clytia hemisphaerica TaxID=252671 RepID=A0A7M5XGY7_9CNID
MVFSYKRGKEVFFFRKNSKVMPLDFDPRAKEVDTKDKSIFKNLRLRTKLVKNESIETPDTVKQNIGLKKRLGNFFNFFKSLKRRKHRKVQPLAVVIDNKRCASFIKDIDCQSVKNETSDTNGGDDQIDGQEVSQMFNRIDKKLADRPINKKLAPIHGSKDDFFKTLEDKVATSNVSNKLAPIANAKEKNEKLKCIIYTKKDYARMDINREGGCIPERPSTPSLTKPKRGLTGGELQLKMIKANERRVETQTQRLRPITARRERFQHCKTKLKISKNNKKSNIENKAEKVENTKLQFKADKIEKKEERKRRHNQKVVDMELAKNDKQQNIVNKTTLAAQRRNEKLEKRAKKLRQRNLNISVQAEMKCQDGLKRPSTPFFDEGAFKSRQPKCEETALKAPILSQRYFTLENSKDLNCAVYEDNAGFGRFDIKSENGLIPDRPDTPSLNKDKRNFTRDELKEKLAKAIDRRAESQTKRLRPITARKERFHRSRKTLENAKLLDQQIQKSYGESKCEKAARNKIQLQNDKVKKIKERNLNVSIRAEMQRMQPNPRPATPIDREAFRSRQPKDQEEPLKPVLRMAI